MPERKGLLAHLGSDLPAGLVVFLVALPLCLGIALASGAPLFSGIISGVIGGIVIGSLSGSQTAVSGPAAGLTVIVLNAITELGAFELFLTATVIAGVLQVVLGILKAGVIGYYFPTSVIKGMLAGIGITLIIKQIPYAIGMSKDERIRDFVPFINDLDSLFSLKNLFSDFSFGSIIITLVSLGILLLWEKPYFKSKKVFNLIPGPLVVVLISIGINKIFKFFIPNLYIAEIKKVNLPRIEHLDHFLDQFMFPDLGGFINPDVWIVAITIAVIASLETLLSLEAGDKIDTYKRVSPPNKELWAQGIGNICNGLIGGIPVTAVIVRTSANITSGSRTKASAIFHGILLLLSVLIIPRFLNLIPLASLAAILLLIGYKLARVSLWRTQYKLGLDQFLPFAVTIVGIIVFDLLKGIGFGMVVGFFFILMRNYKNSYFYKEETDDTDTIHIVLAEEVSFLNKGALINALENIPKGKNVIIDGSNSRVIDYDVLEVIENYRTSAHEKGITVGTINIETVDTGSLH
ncbi:SulP family inorganic anion transporter [Pararhodonellum marinum]|uniref:SulP family inorganic anion transporter n=1 Tax=Pararhodonellum marinum TaxID=2755358 RepID=UPI00188E9892|nr:SulP family inorganic anion transporter [Pararhodonellum marinum]